MCYNLQGIILPTKYKIMGICVDQGKLLPNSGFSAIRKSSQTRLAINKDGLVGDQVVNLKYHGGPLRVVHHYSQKNYRYLKGVFPEIAHKFKMGSYGENITTEELSEEDLCLGDVFSLGSAIVQITVPRKPCAKINATYEDGRILREIVQSQRWGWVYRFVEKGVCELGDWLVF